MSKFYQERCKESYVRHERTVILPTGGLFLLLLLLLLLRAHTTTVRVDGNTKPKISFAFSQSLGVAKGFLWYVDRSMMRNSYEGQHEKKNVVWWWWWLAHLRCLSDAFWPRPSAIAIPPSSVILLAPKLLHTRMEGDTNKKSSAMYFVDKMQQTHADRGPEPAARYYIMLVCRRRV